MGVNLWTSSAHVLDYLGRADSIPHRVEGEATLLEFIPANVRRILDLGTGDGRLLHLLKRDHPNATAVAIDFSPAMLEAARKRFRDDSTVEVIAHNLESPLPDLGKFDAVVSSFAIHHLIHERKRSLYEEVFDVLSPAAFSAILNTLLLPQLRSMNSFCAILTAQQRVKTLLTNCSPSKPNSNGCEKLVLLTLTATGNGETGAGKRPPLVIRTGNFLLPDSRLNRLRFTS